ncbi:MAG TPA: helix-hairpin-helix domain-containing protein [Acidobacteriaceae bacterium]|nr:helix-hairpin-helix domain-containing protein [Acidobacteriaceae bacterium]
MNGTTKQYLLALAAVAGFGLMTACNPPSNDQQLKEQAAQATAQAKQESKEALAQARVAAANAEQAVNDVSAGVKQGLETKTPPGTAAVDVNTASEADLAALPGISVAKAKQIIRHRPYATTRGLVTSGVLTQDQFDAIATKVTAH